MHPFWQKLPCPKLQEIYQFLVMVFKLYKTGLNREFLLCVIYIIGNAASTERFM